MLIDKCTFYILLCNMGIAAIDFERCARGSDFLQDGNIILDRLYYHYWFNPSLALLRHLEALLIKNEIDNLGSLSWPTLDVWSWNGLFAGAIWLKFDVGLEPSDKQSKRSAESWNYNQVVNGDLSNLDSDKFWFVLVNSVAEHVQDLNMFLEQLLRVMKKWWTALFTIPLPNSVNTVHEKVLWDGRFRQLTQDFLEHQNMYSIDTWTSIFQTARFSVQKCLPYLSEMLWNYISANAYSQVTINDKLVAKLSWEMLEIVQKTLAVSHFLLNRSLIQSLESEGWEKTCVLFKLKK